MGADEGSNLIDLREVFAKKSFPEGDPYFALYAAFDRSLSDAAKDVYEIYIPVDRRMAIRFRAYSEDKDVREFMRSLKTGDSFELVRKSTSFVEGLGTVVNIEQAGDCRRGMISYDIPDANPESFKL